MKTVQGILMSRIVTAFFTVVVIGCAPLADRAFAQEPSASGTAASPAQGGPVDYRIGPGDVLNIRVSDAREFDQTIRVSNSGRLRIPFVGIIYAAGMTTAEMEEEIAEKIRDYELVNKPQVRVQLEQYRAWPVHVVGDVVTPGQFVMTGEMYLLDLITKAGGLAASADGTALLYRRGVSRPAVTARVMVGTPTEAESDPANTASAGRPSSEARTITINLDDLRDGKRPDLNIPLQGGDVLYVPRRQGQRIYIIGEVKNPGAYMLPRRGTISAAQAVIYAGGTLLTAKNSSAFLMRYDEKGARQAVPIDFLDIVRGNKPDIPVQPDDIIFVPMSVGKTIGTQLLFQIPRLIQQFVIF